jgi:hypothetical protein
MSAVGLAIAALPGHLLEMAFIGCWITLIASALCVHLAQGLGAYGAIVLSLNAGLWSGCVIALSGTPRDLWYALPGILVCWPAAWIARTRGAIVIKVISSWLIAVAILSATLQLLPVTPGYLADHLE